MYSNDVDIYLSTHLRECKCFVGYVCVTGDHDHEYCFLHVRLSDLISVRTVWRLSMISSLHFVIAQIRLDPLKIARWDCVNRMKKSFFWETRINIRTTPQYSQFTHFTISDVTISRSCNLGISILKSRDLQIAITCNWRGLTSAQCRMSHGAPGSQYVPHETCDDMCHQQCHGSHTHCHMILATRHESWYMCVHVWGSCQAW